MNRFSLSFPSYNLYTFMHVIIYNDKIFFIYRMAGIEFIKCGRFSALLRLCKKLCITGNTN